MADVGAGKGEVCFGREKDGDVEEESEKRGWIVLANTRRRDLGTTPISTAREPNLHPVHRLGSIHP